MTKRPTTFTTNRVHMKDDEFIVSKTDPTGKITYVNNTFCRISGFEYNELIGMPHSLIRHPDMPRTVFAYFWETIAKGEEIFAYVVNACKNGDYYWVLAHATPTYDAGGRIMGYHSNRRKPNEKAVEKVIPLYKSLLQLEEQQDRKDEGIRLGTQALMDVLQGKDFNEFVLSL